MIVSGRKKYLCVCVCERERERERETERETETEKECEMVDKILTMGERCGSMRGCKQQCETKGLI